MGVLSTRTALKGIQRKRQVSLISIKGKQEILLCRQKSEGKFTASFPSIFVFSPPPGVFCKRASASNTVGELAIKQNNNAGGIV